MAERKETKTTKKTKAAGHTVESKQASPSFFDYFRFGESYTSLILGILVVIIATGLLLGFVHNKNKINKVIPQPQNAQNLTKISQTNSGTVMSSATEMPKPTSTPSPSLKATATPPPTIKPTSVPTPKAVATKAPNATATLVPTKKNVAKVNPTAMPTKISTQKQTSNPPANKDKSYLQGRTYVVQARDNLWTIAEKNYGSGYNWVDIARANNLSNPNNVKIGQKLMLPKTEQKNATSEPEWIFKSASSASTSAQAERITAPNYTIKKGDTLWDISVRAYGDGYKWTEIAKENNLSNPNLIYPDKPLKLSRK